MNPNAPQPNFELPTPQATSPGASEGSQEFQIPKPELKNPQPTHPPLQQVAQQTQTTTPQVAGQPQPTQSNQISVNPVTADDSDLIEKEWVTKAKQIVAATKDDPYTQNKQISRFKADYLKKRYHKDIKVEDV